MTDTGTSQDTGSEALTVESAAERIAGLLSDTGDSEAGETQEAQASETAEEADETADDAESETEEAEDDSERQELDDQTLVPVKVGEEEIEVTLHELKRGFHREQDYTRKTMALAEDRKALDAEKSTAAHARESYGTALQRLEEYLSGVTQDNEDLTELRYTDPGEYAARMADRQARQHQLSQVQAERQRVEAEKSAENAKAQADHLKAEQVKLLDALPDWKDPAKAKSDTDLITAYGSKHGLAPEELGAISDHRLVVTLLKAAKWDALQQKKPAVQAKVEAAKTAKPGAKATVSKVSDATRAKQRLAKTGRVQDAAEALMHIL